MDYFLTNWGHTFLVSLVASIGALFTGVFFAILSLKYSVIRLFLSPVVAVSQSFPLQAIAPLILIVLGIGFKTKVIIAFTIAFFPIYSMCITAFYTLPNKYTNIIKINDVKFKESLIHIYLPYCLPFIISACKVGFTLSVLGAVVSEFIQPDKGIGKILLIAQSNYDLESIFISIFMLIVQGLFFYIPLSYYEKRLSKRLHA